MNILDRQSFISGSVRPFAVSTDGTVSDLGGKCNTVLDSGHKLLAHIMAGDANYFPYWIAFVCTDNENDDLEHQISSDATYEELTAGSDFVLVSPFAANPKVDSNRAAVTFTSHTGMSNTSIEDSAYVKRAILLGRTADSPFSAVDFDTAFPLVPDGSFHFGLYWTIAFGPEPETSGKPLPTPTGTEPDAEADSM